MNSTINELISKAMELSPDDRALLAHRIWNSIENCIDPEIEKAWLDEAKRRWIEIESGRVKCIPAEEVFKKAKNEINRL